MKSTQTTDDRPEDDLDETLHDELLSDSSEDTTDETDDGDTDAAEAGDRSDTSDEAGTAAAGGVVAGAAAIVSAGIGLSSITGTSLSEMLRTRKEIIGQIEANSGGGVDQVEVLYGAPWHTVAWVNGTFALIAVLIGGALLAGRARRGDTQPWVVPVAVGGVALGVIGLVVSGGMYLDLFGAQPQLPQGPQAPPGG